MNSQDKLKNNSQNGGSPIDLKDNYAKLNVRDQVNNNDDSGSQMNDDHFPNKEINSKTVEQEKYDNETKGTLFVEKPLSQMNFTTRKRNDTSSEESKPSKRKKSQKKWIDYTI